MNKSKMSRTAALAMLGIAAAVAYTTPNMLSLNQAHGASGGGPNGFGSGGSGFVIKDPVTLKECGDCHQPYGAEALPQGSWRKIMGDLSNHFGEDATLDENTRRQIENYLVSNSQPGDGPLRITETRWFRGAHNREVSQKAMQRAGSMSNCAACHRQSGWAPQKK